MKKREPTYTQKLSCVLCKKTLAWMNAHSQRPSLVICPKCLGKKGKKDAKEQA